MDYRATLETVINGNDLSVEEMRATMDEVMTGQLTAAQIGALLVALRMKSESVDEIFAAASSMRSHATRIDAGAAPIVDTCGTGGDGQHFFNISTTAALIAAGAGVKIAKHGNRSISSKCGSADVLAALGVNNSASPEVVGRCVREVGIGFLFAPALHGAMKHAIGPRRELGVRTIFNMLGPLTNPAGATAQVIGVFARELTPVMAQVLQRLGQEQAMVVHGVDGSDEITGVTNTQVSQLSHGSIETYELDPRPFIGDYCQASDLVGGDAEENAAIVRAILSGEEGPKADVACLNAAAAIVVGGKASNLADGMKLAKDAVSSDKATVILEKLVQMSNA